MNARKRLAIVYLVAACTPIITMCVVKLASCLLAMPFSLMLSLCLWLVQGATGIPAARAILRRAEKRNNKKGPTRFTTISDNAFNTLNAFNAVENSIQDSIQDSDPPSWIPSGTKYYIELGTDVPDASQVMTLKHLRAIE